MANLISYAQNFEDVMLWRALKHVENGFYIDLGAQDPVVDSVSLAFHERGWKGIHVEPTPRFAQLLREQRLGDTVIESAVGNDGDMLVFYEIPDTGISTADPLIAQQHRERGFEIREITVPCVRLSSILKTCGKREIHWMKVDVEGFEKSALTSWGSATARPWIVVVESTLPLTQIETHQQWEPILLRRGYVPVYFDGLNRFYVSNGMAELKKAFNAPPNVFDSFSVNGTASTTIHLHMKARHSAELAAHVQRANSEIDDVKQALFAREAVHAEQLRDFVSQLEAERENGRLQEQTRRSEISTLQAAVTETNGLLIAAKDQFAQVLQAAQQEALKLAQALALREQEYSAQTDVREIAHRTEILTLNAEVVRANGLLTALKDEFAEALHAAKREVLEIAKELAAREQDFSSQSAAREQGHRTEISLLQAEVMRTNGLLIAAKDEFAGMLHTAHQEALIATQLLTAQERDFGTRQLAKEQEFRKMLSTVQSEVERLSNLLLAAKDQFAILQSSAQQDLLKVEKSLFDSEARARTEVNRLAIRERELGEQLVARADALSALQRDAKDEQTALLGQISTIRENASLLALEHQHREHDLSSEISASKALRIQLELDLARISQELEMKHAQEANRAAQLQQLLLVARQENAGLRSTLSWRLTAPLREIGRRLIRSGTSDIPTALKRDAQLTAPLNSVPERMPESKSTYADSGNLQKAPMLPVDTNGNSSGNASQAHDLAELLRLNGEQFIESAYLTLLKRAPDTSGGKFYLDQLLNGVAKIQILDEIGSSAEAQRPAVANLADLLSLNGEQFIECAYFALLRRLPDSSGHEFYFNQLLKGVAKVQILAEIGESVEAQRLDVRLPGLKVAITRYRRTRHPLRGLFVRLFQGVEGSSTSEIRLRSVEQHLLRLAQQSEANHAALAREIGVLAEAIGVATFADTPSTSSTRSMPKPARSILSEQAPLKAGVVGSVIAQLSSAVKQSFEAQQLSIQGNKQ